MFQGVEILALRQISNDEDRLIVADMSPNLLSRPVDVRKYALIHMAMFFCTLGEATN